jgi:hypothetical protein
VITWAHQRGDAHHVTLCGRGRIDKIGTRYEVSVDGEKLAYGKRVRKPYRYEKLGEAKTAASDMMETGIFSSPTHREPKYETYDPSVEGYGNAAQWQAIFEAAVGPNGKVDTEVLAAALGCEADATWAEIKKAYRKQQFKLHPDQGGDAVEFDKAVKAFEALEARYLASTAAA